MARPAFQKAPNSYSPKRVRSRQKPGPGDLSGNSVTVPFLCSGEAGAGGGGRGRRGMLAVYPTDPTVSTLRVRYESKGPALCACDPG